MSYQRKPLPYECDPREYLALMSEGNPGALRVLLDIWKRNADAGYMLCILLDDMNIRGQQVWVAFKYACSEDYVLFVQRVRCRDEEMVRRVNEKVEPYYGIKAVAAGASVERPPFNEGAEGFRPASYWISDEATEMNAIEQMPSSKYRNEQRNE